MSKSGQPKDINELYYGQQCSCGGEVIRLADHPAETLFDMDKLINDALSNVFAGSNIVEGIEPNLWKLTYETLNKAVDEGFGIPAYDSPDLEFVHQLKHNNAVFAAFKAHDQTQRLQNQLVDDQGKLKSYAQFQKDAKSITEEGWRHLKTEYNTGVKRARSAAQFKQFQRTAHLYPNIKWTPSRAANPDATHKGYWGTVLPVNDPFWLTNFPGSRWNCKCGWEVTDDPVTNTPAELPDPVPGLDENPAVSGALYSQSHPVFKLQTKLKKGVEKRVKLGKRQKKAISKVVDSLVRRSDLSEQQKVYALPLNKQYKTHIRFKNGGKVEVHKLVKPNFNDPMDDFKDRMNFAIAHARDGHKVKVLPEIYKTDIKARAKLMPGLENSKSNPDFFLDNSTYADLKRPSAIKNITGNANSACKQGSVVVISDVRLDKKLTEEIMQRRSKAIMSPKNDHYAFDQMYFYADGKVKKYNRQ
ncbi:MAG: phage head morphogenesis protein [Carboxylicivirga sp.]|nr:phage head morphogenesis protein [Carboxylicivirga sp.]